MVTNQPDGDEMLTPQFRAMNGRDKWETLVLSGLIGTDEPWTAAMTQTLRDEAATRAQPAPTAPDGDGMEAAREICAKIFDGKADALANAPLPNMAAVKIVRQQAEDFRQGQRDSCEQMEIAVAALASREMGR